MFDIYPSQFNRFDGKFVWRGEDVCSPLWFAWQVLPANPQKVANVPDDSQTLTFPPSSGFISTKTPSKEKMQRRTVLVS